MNDLDTQRIDVQPTQQIKRVRNKRKRVMPPTYEVVQWLTVAAIGGALFGAVIAFQPGIPDSATTNPSPQVTVTQPSRGPVRPVEATTTPYRPRQTYQPIPTRHRATSHVPAPTTSQPSPTTTKQTTPPTTKTITPTPPPTNNPPTSGGPTPTQTKGGPTTAPPPKLP